MIMAESLFDIENIEELTFNQEIEPTLRQFKKGTLISPRYGGYTSAVEYEALTGLSLAFYPSGLVPYTTYFNQMDKRIPSVAAEFNDNGYVTYAIHPNDKTFYNRDIAYQELGFDTFLDKTAFTLTDDNMVAGEFLKDMPIAEKIEDLIEEHEEPVFAFAVTIAGHYMGNDRYKQTNVKVSCDLLNESERHEIEQAATAYQETDQMLQSLIEYVQASEEPTLVYIFGDHLPPLPEFSKLDYLNNAYQKYGTCLAAYSNFMEIEMPEYITPNQLAAQLMRDSGINHSSYYDYIYSLREKYPVIHSEFCTVKGNPDMDMYRMIQYDIMFGNHWFYEEKQ
jgi:phosphoglycerol transferase MdoB-like AlkP superfamily enzyme